MNGSTAIPAKAWVTTFSEIRDPGSANSVAMPARSGTWDASWSRSKVEKTVLFRMSTWAPSPAPMPIEKPAMPLSGLTPCAANISHGNVRPAVSSAVMVFTGTHVAGSSWWTKRTWLREIRGVDVAADEDAGELEVADVVLLDQELVRGQRDEAWLRASQLTGTRLESGENADQVAAVAAEGVVTDCVDPVRNDALCSSSA